MKLNQLSTMAWIFIMTMTSGVIMWKLAIFPELVEFWSLKLCMTSKFAIEAVFMLDKYALLFSSSVLMITSSILFFSKDYMKQESYYIRFHLLVLAFVTSMIALIFSLNMVSIILGWDGLGLSSYLLVIYYQSPKSFNAGMLTALSNRVGDVFIMASCALGSFLESCNFYVENMSKLSVWTAFAMVVMMASITKSAQIPFSAWLPAAMAAPTPVSALVHSSTLVTAGIYLMFRFSEALSNPTLSLMTWLGTLTMLMAGLSALGEMDSKKVVALSTLSQLGLMFSSLGLGAQKIAFFHLIMHAFMKAMLFITMGNTIHNSFSSQDLRVSKQSECTLIVSKTFLMMANLGLMGVPFLAGFYSKDLWLEYSMNTNLNFMLMIMFYLSVSLTVVYSMRLMGVLFLKNSKQLNTTIFKDWDKYNLSSMSILWVMTVSIGATTASVLMTVPFFSEISLSVKNFTLDVIFYSLLISVSMNTLAWKHDSYMFTKNLWGLAYFSASTSSMIINPASKTLNIFLESKAKIKESAITSFTKVLSVLELEKMSLTTLAKYSFGTTLLILVMILWV